MRKSGRATISAMIRSEWLMMAMIANDSGSSTISSSPIVMIRTASQRLPPTAFCVRSISGQVAITSVVAHTVAARNGWTTRKVATIRPMMNSGASVRRARSYGGCAMERSSGGQFVPERRLGFEGLLHGGARHHARHQPVHPGKAGRRVGAVDHAPVEPEQVDVGDRILAERPLAVAELLLRDRPRVLHVFAAET